LIESASTLCSRLNRSGPFSLFPFSELLISSRRKFFRGVRGVSVVRGALKVFNYSLLSTHYSLIKSFPFSALIPLRGLFTAPSRHSLQAASALDLIAAVRFLTTSVKLNTKFSVFRFSFSVFYVSLQMYYAIECNYVLERNMGFY